MLIGHQLTIETLEMDRILSNPTYEGYCRRLSHGGSSGMNRALDHYHVVKQTEGRHIDAKGIFARHLGEYVGWALWTRETDNFSFKPTPGQVAFQVYVAANYRRKGVGTRLLQHACSLTLPDEKVHVYYWSNPSFFEPFKNQGLCGEVR